MPHLERMLKRALSCLSDVRTISKPPYLREAVASLEASEIIRNGQVIALCSGSQRVVDQWVKRVARTTRTQLDWMYRAGYVMVYCLGEAHLRQKALDEIQKGYAGLCIVTILAVSDEAYSSLWKF